MLEPLQTLTLLLAQCSSCRSIFLFIKRLGKLFVTFVKGLAQGRTMAAATPARSGRQSAKLAFFVQGFNKKKMKWFGEQLPPRGFPQQHEAEVCRMSDGAILVEHMPDSVLEGSCLFGGLFPELWCGPLQTQPYPRTLPSSTTHTHLHRGGRWEEGGRS